MKVIVPDASVLLKWVLPEEGEKYQIQALLIRDAAIHNELALKVPSLWFYEVCNTLSRLYPKQCHDIVLALRSFQLEEVQWNNVWLDKALMLTRDYQVTFYDAAYHGLAMSEEGTFVTADQEYVSKTQKAGAILALKDWS